MLKIKNLKTEQSEIQIKQSWIEVEAIRSRLLSSSDWTQLSDINIENGEDIIKWRKNLRKLKIREEFDNVEQAKNFLGDYEKIFPSIIYGKPIPADQEQVLLADLVENRIEALRTELITELNVSQHTDEIDAVIDEKILTAVSSIKQYIDYKFSELEAEKTVVDEVIEPNVEEITPQKAQTMLLKSYRREKHGNLIEAGALEFAMINEKMNQATEYLVEDDKNLNNYSLLMNNDVLISDLDYVNNLMIECKNYFKDLYKIEKEYLQKTKSMYTMSIRETNEELIKYGHRYRCADQS